MSLSLLIKLLFRQSLVSKLQKLKKTEPGLRNGLRSVFFTHQYFAYRQQNYKLLHKTFLASSSCVFCGLDFPESKHLRRRQIDTNDPKKVAYHAANSSHQKVEAFQLFQSRQA